MCVRVCMCVCSYCCGQRSKIRGFTPPDCMFVQASILDQDAVRKLGEGMCPMSLLGTWLI